jgi:hypothetical protein
MNAQPAAFEKLQLPICQRLTKLPAQDLLQNLAFKRKGVSLTGTLIREGPNVRA